jgi:hypothetical protein
MKAIYRTVSALLAILSGLVIAGLVTVLIDDREIRVVWFIVFAAGAILAAAAAILLWARAGDRR